MPYVTHIERRGIQQGIQQGIQRGESLLVVRLLKKKLGNLDTMLVEKLSALAIEELEELSEALLDFESRADLDAWLASRNS